MSHLSAPARPPLAHAHSTPHPLAQSTLPLPAHAASSPLADAGHSGSASGSGSLGYSLHAHGLSHAHDYAYTNGHAPPPGLFPPAQPAPAPAAPTGPRRIEPERADVEAAKRALHDALGEAGLPYWKALNGYLVGQVGRAELVGLVHGWLKTKVKLHNRLLLSLLTNAAFSPSARAASPGRKRRRAVGDAPDLDPDVIEPRARAHAWAMGLGGKERARVRRCLGRDEDDEGDREVDKERDKAGPYAQPLLPPLAQSARHLPSSHNLSTRLGQIASSYGLDVAPDHAAELGELAALAVDAHVADILHALVALTARGRPGVDTVRGRAGVVKPAEDGEDGAARESAADGVPRPQLKTLHALFDLAPGLHPQASPALYKLGTGYTEAERLVSAGDRPSPKPGAPEDDGGDDRPRDRDALAKLMAEAGLLKVDKAGRDGEDGERKKDKKHGSHWRYEDPAVILRDVLG
ncbi:hypothetical protein Q5752_002488 [Cryptotrichosporon argae]